MSANVLPFPVARHTPAATAPEWSDTELPQPLVTRCRFTLEARNSLNGLTYALPLWGVRFGEHGGDGREWAAIFDIRQIDHAFAIITAEPDSRLALYDGRGGALGTFETPAELLAALRCWI